MSFLIIFLIYVYSLLIVLGSFCFSYASYVAQIVKPLETNSLFVILYYIEIEHDHKLKCWTEFVSAGHAENNKDQQGNIKKKLLITST